VILAIDQGTTGTTCMVFSEDGKIAGRAYREFEQHFPKPGWVEHDANEIWDVTEAVANEAIRAAGIAGADLHAIGITNQRETVVAWDKNSGKPLANAIVWQDRRTADRCKQLKDEGKEQLVRERTGLVLDPYFSGTKIEWLINEGGVDASTAAFGTIDSWLIHKLCDGRFATDYTNASRTLLFDIGELSWSEELCAMLGVDAASLPEPCPSAHEFGRTSIFGGSVPVAGVAGDQQAALYGQACQEAGLGKNTYGTGSFVLENAGGDRPAAAEGLLTTVAWGVADRVDYALEAAIFVTGAAVQWLRDGLGVIKTADETEGLARSLRSNDGVYFVPALTGLGSPHWDPYARGTIVGLTRGTTKAHLARAALEAMAYQTVDAVRAMEASSGVKLEELRADGGATANAWMLQFQADMLGIPVVVPQISETTALGAAYLAGVATGAWSESDIPGMWKEAARYEPQMGEGQREELIEGWRGAVATARNHSHRPG
jgi:glycerol kinase